MSCSCIKGNSYNFDIEELDTHSFRYTDLSIWMNDANYEIPENHEVHITIPDLDKSIIVKIKPNSSTVITSELLGLGGQCIPDGIYCFEAYACYSCSSKKWGERKFTKQESILTETKCRVDNLIATSEEEDKASEFRSRIKKIEAAAKIGQPKKAAQIYQFLQDELDVYNCDSCC